MSNISPLRIFSISILLLLSACAALPPAPSERYFWPPPPDVPRIEWIKSYSSQIDIDKNSTQAFWASISGDDSPVSFVKPLEVKSIAEMRRFYVSDIGKQMVVVYDLGGHAIRNLSTPEDASRAIMYPLSIAYDAEYNLYLLDRRANGIIVFDKNEKYKRFIDFSTIIGIRPVAMSIDRKTSRLLVADGGSKKVLVLDLQGRFLFSIGSGGNADGQFNLPISTAVNSLGEIIVGDAFNAAVQIFSSDGKFLRKFGQRGDRTGDFQLIKAVAVDSDDNIYVVDGRSHSVSIFNRQGELLLSLGSYYAVSTTGKIAPGGFSVPVGIDIDSDDRIYIVDQLNARVQVFQYLSQKYQNRPAAK